MAEDGRRLHRVAASVREHLEEALRREIDDARLSSLVITSVVMSPDLALAAVRVRLMVGDENERDRRRAMGALRAAGARLRRGLSGKLRLKRLPELRFHYDTGHDNTGRIEALLHEIAEEPKGTTNE